MIRDSFKLRSGGMLNDSDRDPDSRGNMEMGNIVGGSDSVEHTDLWSGAYFDCNLSTAHVQYRPPQWDFQRRHRLGFRLYRKLLLYFSFPFFRGWVRHTSPHLHSSHLSMSFSSKEGEAHSVVAKQVRMNFAGYMPNMGYRNTTTSLLYASNQWSIGLRGSTINTKYPRAPIV
ncbi:hypothetical protein K504DRAFT_102155 [Pleomassaria siparia CBS 279.74]|uniref:Uncharacterized protein n=1 Tax=Pleomassaria siparia CBS 279.74 TaxID=1314801 RepID=A0A6G1JX95_9PLEO|nr:hypothetical protein K504DRAFT_102155 [Pleomassaria siparia CBS 279.74]